MFIIGLPPIWTIVGLTYKTWGHWAFGFIMIACFLLMIFVYLKIKEINDDC